MCLWGRNVHWFLVMCCVSFPRLVRQATVSGNLDCYCTNNYTGTAKMTKPSERMLPSIGSTARAQGSILGHNNVKLFHSEFIPNRFIEPIVLLSAEKHRRFSVGLISCAIELRHLLTWLPAFLIESVWWNEHLVFAPPLFLMRGSSCLAVRANMLPPCIARTASTSARPCHRCQCVSLLSFLFSYLLWQYY